MNIKTAELQRVTALALAGCGQSSQITITQLMGLKTWVDEETGVKDLVFCSTDTINFIYVKLPIETDEDLDLCVNAQTFAQLVSKFTVEETHIEYVPSGNGERAHLLVRANGEYKLAVALLDNGYFMQLPNDGNFCLAEGSEFMEPVVVSVEKAKNLKAVAEGALSTMESEVDLNGYFSGDDMSVATNRKTMVVIDDPIGIGLVLRKKFIDLITLSREEDILVARTENGRCIMAYDNELTVWSSQNSPVENYPSKQIESLVKGSSHPFGCLISPKAAIDSLDRLSLMVTKYDSDTIELSVIGGMMLASSLKATGSECIELEPIDEAHPIDAEFSWSGRVNCEWLKEQLSTFGADKVELWVGDKKSIKLCSGNITKLICLA